MPTRLGVYAFLGERLAHLLQHPLVDFILGGKAGLLWILLLVVLEVVDFETIDGVAEWFLEAGEVAFGVEVEVDELLLRDLNW